VARLDDLLKGFESRLGNEPPWFSLRTVIAPREKGRDRHGCPQDRGFHLETNLPRVLQARIKFGQRKSSPGCHRDRGVSLDDRFAKLGGRRNPDVN